MVVKTYGVRQQEKLIFVKGPDIFIGLFLLQKAAAMSVKNLLTYFDFVL